MSLNRFTETDVAAGIKDEARELIANLPEDSTWDDLMRAIYERLVIDRGIADFEAGRKLGNDEVRRRYGLQP